MSPILPYLYGGNTYSSLAPRLLYLVEEKDFFESAYKEVVEKYDKITPAEYRSNLKKLCHYCGLKVQDSTHNSTMIDNLFRVKREICSVWTEGDCLSAWPTEHFDEHDRLFWKNNITGEIRWEHLGQKVPDWYDRNDSPADADKFARSDCIMMEGDGEYTVEALRVWDSFWAGYGPFEEKVADWRAHEAARKAQERAAREAQERAAREAQERAAREAQERAAREAQERAAREARERAAREAQEARKRAAREAQVARQRAAREARVARQRAREADARREGVKARVREVASSVVEAVLSFF